MGITAVLARNLDDVMEIFDPFFLRKRTVSYKVDFNQCPTRNFTSTYTKSTVSGAMSFFQVVLSLSGSLTVF